MSQGDEGVAMWTFGRDRTDDIEAGRLLARLTLEQFAAIARQPVGTVQSAERGEVSDGMRAGLVRVLEGLGVIFEAKGIVRHQDGRLAPTKKAVGRMTGSRIARARNALGLAQMQLASLAKIGGGTVARLEAQGELRLTASVYAAVGALQLAGYRFGRNKTDKALAPRLRRKEEPHEHDISERYFGVGLHVWGFDDPDADG